MSSLNAATTDAGLDIDTAYGQLLRRVTDTGPGDVRYAIVVPVDCAGHRRLRGEQRRRGAPALTCASSWRAVRGPSTYRSQDRFSAFAA